MILYHGSNLEIEVVDFNKSKPGKDFGVGFYLSPEIRQAQEMAEKKSLLLGGKPTVTLFEYDEQAAMADADIAYLRYDCYCIEWGKFVKMNRDNKTYNQLHSYDIIYGPIANDNIGLQMRRIDVGMIDWDQFVKELEFKGGETYQYFFGTKRSLKYLRKL
jgi:hypothetical protein